MDQLEKAAAEFELIKELQEEIKKIYTIYDKARQLQFERERQAQGIIHLIKQANQSVNDKELIRLCFQCIAELTGSKNFYYGQIETYNRSRD